MQPDLENQQHTTKMKVTAVRTQHLKEEDVDLKQIDLKNEEDELAESNSSSNNEFLDKEGKPNESQDDLSKKIDELEKYILCLHELIFSKDQTKNKTSSDTTGHPGSVSDTKEIKDLNEEMRNMNDVAPSATNPTTIPRLKRIIQQNLYGISRSAQKEELDIDVYSMMMLTSFKSLVWMFGLVSFGIQIILGILVIMDQATKKELFGTFMSIPIRGNPSLQIVQFLAIRQKQI